jgi:hypothetical protein
MQKIFKLTLGALGIVSLASACTMEAAVEAPAEEVGTEQGALVCANHQATDALLADIAAAAARELGRWNPKSSTKDGDIDFDYSTHTLKLTSTGTTRCAEWKQPNGSINNCFYLKNALSYQTWNAGGHGSVIQGSIFDFGVWQNRVESYWKRQMTCMDRPDNGMADNCPAEAHDLKYTGASVINPATTCAIDYKFHAYKAKTSSIGLFSQDLASADAKQLGNRLLWAGWDLPGVYSRNPWINFQSDNAANVSIDPGPGNEEGTTGTSGSTILRTYNFNAQAPAMKYEVYASSDTSTQGKPCGADPMRSVCNPMTGCPTATGVFKKRAMTAQYDCCVSTIGTCVAP